MTTEEHKQRHIELHKALDELAADWLEQNPGKYPSGSTILELMRWSHGQTVNPTQGHADLGFRNFSHLYPGGK